jgi:DNA polymerase
MPGGSGVGGVAFPFPSLLGSSFRVTKERGKDLGGDLVGHAKHVVATVHPASVLRAPDDDSRAAARADFVADLKVVAKLLR